MLGYLALLFTFILLFALSFYFGLREWLRPQDDTPLPVDVEYVRLENYFGLSFRAKMREWLETARTVPAPEPWKPPLRAVLEKPNGERILLVSGDWAGDRQERGELVYSEGDLRLSDHCVFHREIYCRGKFESGLGVQLQAVAADGALTLGFDNVVFRWVDAHGKVLLRRGTAVYSRVSSAVSIELEPEVVVQSLFAPQIVSAGYRPEAGFDPGGGLPDQPVRGDPRSAAAPVDLPVGLDPKHCTRLAADTWRVNQDLELPPNSRIECNLVVEGELRSGADCWFTSNVKATGVRLGPRNRVLRNLISAGALELGESSFVGENVAAETDIRLRPGVRVGRPNRLSALSAGQEVRIEANVAVCGKLIAGRAVIAL